MWRVISVLVVVWAVLAFPFFALAQETPTQTHVVQAGENLFRIGLQYGFTAEELALANNLVNPSQIYVGQVLILPIPIGGGEELPVSTSASTEAIPADIAPFVVAPADTTTTTMTEPVTTSVVGQAQTTHIVQANEGLAGIAKQYGVSWVAVAEANGITNPNLIYAGQQLTIPNPTLQPPADYGQPVTGGVTGRRIVVELSKQTISAYENEALLRQVVVSTGLPGTPTVLGEYAIYSKLPEQTMYGPGYYLPGVPWVMYFYQGYAIHGTYWHNNFGQPMSHGCVNLPSEEAAWFYEFAAVGTPVTVLP